MIYTPFRTGNCYQIDTAVANQSVDCDEFLDIWRTNNPNRAVRTVIMMEFEPDFAYIILYHQ